MSDAAKAKRDAYQRAYRERHREELNAKAAQYRESHRKELAAASRAWHAANRERASARSRRYREEHAEELRAKKREYHATHRKESAASKRLATFGVTQQQYDAMLALHDGGCWICGGVNKSGRDLAVDHCHRTGIVRGLLCSNCNSGIGKIGDTAAAVQRAADYLARHEAATSIMDAA